MVLGDELARLLRIELPAQAVHVRSRRPGHLADIPNPLL